MEKRIPFNKDSSTMQFDTGYNHNSYSFFDDIDTKLMLINQTL